jgi:Ig-like domain CHU_C associated/Dual-action HEIGH metallo-peptidase
MRSRLVLILLLVASTGRAATYLVGTDREMIRSASAIVVVTAGESISVRSPRGTIETATHIRVDEAISGPLNTGDGFDIFELGGFVGDIGLAVSGSPRFAQGERGLLLLEKNADDEWTTKAMGLGRFTFTSDVAGRQLLVRDEGEIFGWNIDGTPHAEQRRAAEPFLQFVRETARGGDPAVDYLVPRTRLIVRAEAIQTNAAAASTYCIQQNGMAIRWNVFPAPIVFSTVGTQPGATNGGLTAAGRGIAVWTNDSGSNINYQLGGTRASSGGLQNSDGAESILFNDPNGEISGSFNGTNGAVLAIGGAWFGNATHTFNGETFLTIQEADLVVQNGINTGGGGPGLTGNGFDHVLAHELGHTLGFRHSDDLVPGGTSTTAALMDSSVDFNNDRTGAALQAWDQEAASAVYGTTGGPPPCNPPVIATQPQSSDFHNVPVALSVTVSGTASFSYQWFVGTRGDTRQPAANGTGPVLTVSPAQTTSYWVRVTGQCSPTADSDTATITVNGCPGVNISSISSSTSIIQGRSETLSAFATSGSHGVTYQWFAGAIGDTSRPAGSGPSVTVTPPATQSYWLQVSNDCNAVATSDLVTITVTPCNTPQVVIQPSNADVVSGFGATISATLTGTQPMLFQWYQGSFPDTTHPVPNATTASFTTDPLFAGASFWLQANNPCGSASTNAAVIRVVATCTGPVIITQPQNQTVASGSSAIVTVTASGPSLTYAWYQGQVFDFTHPVGGSAPSLATPAITAPTQFWVRITNPCGDVRSVAATVSPATGRRRSVRR